ncbi:hypothetical protein NV379_13005 [Paenibacillus sp. N1-5-1-14]|uniref:hypothetical protein n=1 Tax=Paenibacillus radicibacter TaxID=2972488 RepID=UPI0021593DFC|nr:hypothetical protein [Paenibacillus radicibacter]MCR8643573.1 hypothetical protein [Paenibacillus radicibacter]
MIKGAVDLFVFPQWTEDTMSLTLGNPATGPLVALPDRSSITLQHGNLKRTLQIEVERATGEYFYHSLGISPIIAKQLKLKSGYRYALEYDEIQRLIKIKRTPSSRGVFTFRERLLKTKSKMKPIIFGYSVAGELGLPEGGNVVLQSQKGMVSPRLKIGISPALDDDEVFIMSGEWARRFGLVHGQRYVLEYNQITKMLNINPNPIR